MYGSRATWLAAALAALVSSPAPVHARGALAAPASVKKGIWCPARPDPTADFALYRQLGIGVCSIRMPWNSVALRRPRRPRDPGDPAYAWSPSVDALVAIADRAGMRVAIEVQNSPSWANGGRPGNWVPRHVRDYAAFMAAAARHYPQVDYWVIWAEPTRRANFLPLTPDRGARRLTRAERRAPHYYARLLDAAYGAIKRVRPHAQVVGGNTFTVGDISPLNWIRNLRLPNGRPPRMDLYGHHPFTARRPDLRRRMQNAGYADFSDLDRVAIWIDRYLGRAPGGARLRLWLGEWTIPTARSLSFNFWVTPRTQAAWIRAGYRIAERWWRVESLVWLQLYDDAPGAGPDPFPGGLIRANGRRKPGFAAFAAS